ncbi:MAG: hypothetical protein MPI95_02985 [Nitrosopumilus sp.]|nr:hypothetical protein [Nitrosopumilus sp.]MDA7958041.1 hypothetical protein [Nitrosopumilus sp.]
MTPHAAALLALAVPLALAAAPAALGQAQINPSLIIEDVEIQYGELDYLQRDAPVIDLGSVHAVSWQVTLDNNLVYSPGGTAVFRIYDDESPEEFIEVGMGAPPDLRYWVAVQTPREGYVVVHRDLERGWYPVAKTVISYTDRAGLTVNNGARIVVTNLDIGTFAIKSYATHGLESSTDRLSATAGSISVEFLSGDPGENIYSLYPFFIAAAVGGLVGALFITKRR